MTPKDFFTNLQTWLRGCVWTGTTNKIFGDNVHVVPILPTQQISRMIFPACFLVDTGGSFDSSHPYILEQNFTIGIWLENVQSEFGEGVMLSACRVAGTSQGAGLLDIENEIFGKICDIETLSSTKISLIEKAKTTIQVTQNNFPLVTRVWTLSCLLSLY